MKRVRLAKPKHQAVKQLAEYVNDLDQFDKKHVQVVAWHDRESRRDAALVLLADMFESDKGLITLYSNLLARALVGNGKKVDPAILNELKVAGMDVTAVRLEGANIPEPDRMEFIREVKRRLKGDGDGKALT